MAHDLSIRANGRVEMAYVGRKAWHGLGNLLDRGQPIEAWQTAAGMDWKIPSLANQVRDGTRTDGRLQPHARPACSLPLRYQGAAIGCSR
jgi:hypothetical protein